MVVAAVVGAPAVVAGSESPARPSREARAEMQAALSAMQSLSINVGRIDWSHVRRDAFRRLQGAQSTAEADRAVEATLAALGDNHSSLEAAADVLHPGEVVSFGLTALDPGGVVAAVAPAGPAAAAGIQTGDIVQ